MKITHGLDLTWMEQYTYIIHGGKYIAFSTDKNIFKEMLAILKSIIILLR